MFRAALPQTACLVLAGLCVLAPGIACAEPEAPRGALIAMGGGPGGPPAACFTCHGIGGAGQAATGTPALAGLDADYLRRQLDDYASGTRPDSLMTPIAQALGPTDRHAVARHYAGLPRGPVEVAARHDAALLQEGAALYAAGAPHRGLQACIDCHGPAGRGLGATPALAGQPAAYTAQQLRLWQRGERVNDPDGVMARVAKAMTAREIDAVAAYLEGFTSAVRSSRRDPSRDPP